MVRNMLSLPARPLRSIALSLALAALATACASPRYHLDPDELARFEAAGPITPEFDEERLLESIKPPSVYRVIPGDLLMIRAPASLTLSGAAVPAFTAASSLGPIEHFARVADDGMIDVPLAGPLPATGRTVRELERAIADAIHPRFLSTRPPIVVTVEEPHTVPVTIVGAVETPGIHHLSSDQMTLSGALTSAGGIVKTGNLVVGARKIVIYSPNEEGRPTVHALPIRGLNVPFYDAPLVGGERIEVERFEPDRFTVVGLVAKPGAYEYPPEIEYNLMQALATAGGVDRIADPPFATVFRKDLLSGEIIPATFALKGDGIVAASALRIKPGDVVSIGHTKASWTRAFMADVFRINIGFFPRVDNN